MTITKREAFDVGFKFANRIRGCWDSRDVGRVLTCDDFPPEVQAMAAQMNGFRAKEAGVHQAISLIHELLTTME